MAKKKKHPIPKPKKKKPQTFLYLFVVTLMVLVIFILLNQSAKTLNSNKHAELKNKISVLIDSSIKLKNSILSKNLPDNTPTKSSSNKKEVVYKIDFSESLAYPEHTEADHLVKHTGYALSYNEKHEQANWVAYELTKEELSGTAKRSNNFRPDPMIISHSASPEDYKGSGYDRGHLAPAADFKWSEEAMSQSFFMSNMSPQLPAFNRGIWKQLEEQMRSWAQINHSIFIITGPVFNDSLMTIGENEVGVPLYYYKAALDAREPEIKMIAFLLPNKKLEAPLNRYVLTVDSLESIINLNLFHALPDKLEDSLEQYDNSQLWFNQIDQ